MGSDAIRRRPLWLRAAKDSGLHEAWSLRWAGRNHKLPDDKFYPTVIYSPARATQRTMGSLSSTYVRISKLFGARRVRTRGGTSLRSVCVSFGKVVKKEREGKGPASLVSDYNPDSRSVSERQRGFVPLRVERVEGAGNSVYPATSKC
jgi:hypothetical protein